MAVERKALIFNIQKYNLHDGPGIRTLVFFKGCPLRCQWCSNPEGQKRQFQVLFKQERCVDCGACVEVCPAQVHVLQDRKHLVLRDKECIGCRKCEASCRKGALSVVGEQRTISDIIDVIEEDRPFYQSSGGGVTLGGGEVLMQPEAALNLLSICHQRGLHTAIETCGYTRLEVIQKIAPHVDLFLFDIKQMDSEQHYYWTGVRNEPILTNLVWLLENGYNVKIRVPLLKGVNESQENLRAMIDFLRPWQDYHTFKGVDLLPYHKMGVNKYTQLGRNYPLQIDPVLSDADLEQIEAFMNAQNFPVSVIRH